MAAENSFDIVCRVDMQEVKNAIQQALKEIATRFDFRGTNTEIRLVENALEVASSEEFKVKSAYEVLEARLVKRGVPVKALRPGAIEQALGGRARQRIELQVGIPIEAAREIVKIVKGTKLKVQAAIQGDQVRVSGKNKDDLQQVMRLLRESELGVALQFSNYR
jgi:hypothetical protein